MGTRPALTDGQPSPAGNRFQNQNQVDGRFPRYALSIGRLRTQIGPNGEQVPRAQVPALAAMSMNTVRHSYSRHIEIRKHYLRELCLSGIVKLIPLHTYHMVTDTLTKSLPVPGLVCHRGVMMGHSTFCARILRDTSGG